PVQVFDVHAGSSQSGRGPGRSRTRVANTPGWRRSVGPQVHATSQGSGGRTHALRLPRPADYRFPTPCASGPPGNRTPISALRRRASSCWTSSPREVRPGVEPGLPRLPGRRAAATLPDLRVAEAGFEPAWGRLMRPCWEPGSSPLRSTPGRTRTCARLHVMGVPWPLGYGAKRQWSGLVWTQRPPRCERGEHSRLLPGTVGVGEAGIDPAWGAHETPLEPPPVHSPVSRAGRSRTCLPPRIRRL